MLRIKIHSIIKFYLYPFFVEKPGFYRTWNLAHTLQVFGKDLSPTYSVNDVKFCQKNYLFQEEKRLFSPSSPLHPLIHTCMPVFPPILIKCSNIFLFKKGCTWIFKVYLPQRAFYLTLWKYYFIRTISVRPWKIPFVVFM